MHMNKPFFYLAAKGGQILGVVRWAMAVATRYAVTAFGD
jgi:hypothetical protein